MYLSINKYKLNMDKIYYSLDVIGQYLSTSLKPGKIIFNKQYAVNNEYFEPLIENALFTINYCEINNNDNSIKKKIICFRYKDLENIFIAKHLMDCSNEFELKEFDDDNYYFETTGIIPLRWLYMIKDFYWKHSEIQELTEINYSELLQKIPEIALNQILLNSWKTKKTYCFQVINLDESKLWQTLNGEFSEYTKKIIKSCNSYLSLRNNDTRDSYQRLFAYEGGVEIFNNYIKDYIKFNHNYFYSGSFRNEMKGKTNYRTGKDINLEEILCFYLALKDKGVSLSKLESK